MPHWLLTGGLDGLIRILDVQINTVVDDNGPISQTTGHLVPLHGIRRASPVMLLALSEDGMVLAMGNVNRTPSA